MRRKLLTKMAIGLAASSSLLWFALGARTPIDGPDLAAVQGARPSPVPAVEAAPPIRPASGIAGPARPLEKVRRPTPPTRSGPRPALAALEEQAKTSRFDSTARRRPLEDGIPTAEDEATDPPPRHVARAALVRLTDAGQARRLVAHEWVTGVEPLVPGGIEAADLARRFPARSRRADGPSALSFPADRWFVVRIGEETDAGELLDALRQLAGIEHAEAIGINRPMLRPDDPVVEAWQDEIDLPGAWDLTTGSAGITIAVLDTGVDRNDPELAGRLFVNAGEIPGNGIDDDSNGYVDDVSGYDFVAGTGDVRDSDGHGTTIARVIGGQAGNRSGSAGIDWRARILPIKVLARRRSHSELTDSIEGPASSLAAGIVYATNMGADVINLSHGGSYRSAVVEEAIQFATSHGVAIVAAAGNKGLEAAYFTPGGVHEAITVGAVGGNRGPKVELSAPVEGTSMAAAITSGVLSLALSVAPDLTISQLRALLARTATDVGPAGWDASNGHGRIDARAAVEAASRTSRRSAAQARITSPREFSNLTGPTEVQATLGGDVGSYLLEMGIGHDPVAWSTLVRGTASTSGPLATIDPAGLRSWFYTLRLTAVLHDGRRIVDHSYVYLCDQAAYPLSVGRQGTSPLIGNADLRPGQSSPALGLGSPGFLADASGAARTGWQATALPVAGPFGIFDLLTTGAELALADLDGDGAAEAIRIDTLRRQVVVGPAAGGTAHSFSTPGLAGARNLGLTDAVNRPAVADLDGDGDREIVISTQSGQSIVIEVVDGQGRSLPGWPAMVPGSNIHSIAIGDIDGDGKREIAIAPYGRELTVLDHRGRMVAGFPRPIRSQGFVAMADVDGDGDHEVLVVTRYTLEAYDETGSRLWRASASAMGLTVGDLDGDGRPEFALQGYGGLTVVGHDGRIRSGFPVRSSEFSSRFASCPTIADVDGDGTAEILALAQLRGDVTRIVAIDAGGRELLGYRATVPASYNIPAIGDCDGDGRLEIVSADSLGNVYKFDLPGASSGRRPTVDWGMLGGNPRRTNAWELLTGDVNGDEVFDGRDLEALASLPTGPSRQRQAADVDGDGRVGPADRRVLEAYLVGDIDSIPYAARFGDADRDGDVDFSDAYAVYYHIIGYRRLDGEGSLLADVDLDGSLTFFDVNTLVRFVNGQIASLPETR